MQKTNYAKISWLQENWKGINMYKRKGGHIYTKVTTNRRVANLNQDN